MTLRSYTRALIAAIAVAAPLVAQSSGTPSVHIVLNERTRLLQGQLFDLVLEVRNAKTIGSLKVTDSSGLQIALLNAYFDSLGIPRLTIRWFA